MGHLEEMEPLTAERAEDLLKHSTDQKTALLDHLEAREEHLQSREGHLLAREESLLAREQAREGHLQAREENLLAREERLQTLQMQANERCFAQLQTEALSTIQSLSAHQARFLEQQRGDLTHRLGEIVESMADEAKKDVGRKEES